MEKTLDYVTRQIADETIIVPVRGGVGELQSIYTVNEPGAGIWQMVRDGMPPDRIVDAICRQYEVSAEAATRDVMSFMDDLRTSGLIPGSTEQGV
jgi:hypothetical protein